MVSEALFYARTDVVRQVSDVVSNTTADEVGKVILIVNSSFDFFCKSLQLGVFFILYAFGIFVGGSDCGVFRAEIHNTLLARCVAQKPLDNANGIIPFVNMRNI